MQPFGNQGQAFRIRGYVGRHGNWGGQKGSHQNAQKYNNLYTVRDMAEASS